MLPEKAWRPHEPRFGFPVFKGVQSLVSFSIYADFSGLDYPEMGKALLGSFKQGYPAVKSWALNNAPLLRYCRGKNLRFRMLVNTRQGEYLGMLAFPGDYPPGGTIDVDMSEVLRSLKLPDDDYMATLIMSNGMNNHFRASPGSYSMTYVGDRFYSTYRTGGFARTLNDPKRKKHSGFRGINPKVVATPELLSSILLINHSSDPAYDATVTPTALLLRADGATREAPFGAIRAFGGVERTVEELFGDDVVDFLAPFGGKATSIITCPGVTLASIHLMRARDGSSMSIEHSRPTHTYLLNGLTGD